MAALTAARFTESKNTSEPRAYLMAASTTIYAGSLVMINANGLAVPAVAGANNAGVHGVADETVTSAASGSYYIRVRTGVFKFTAASIAQTDVGNVMYASDDQTFDETQGANEPVAGILHEYVSATSGWLRIGPEFVN